MNGDGEYIFADGNHIKGTLSLFDISDNDVLLFDVNARNAFEAACLGNKNSSLLSFGDYCEKGNIICKSCDNTVFDCRRRGNHYKRFSIFLM